MGPLNPLGRSKATSISPSTIPRATSFPTQLDPIEERTSIVVNKKPPLAVDKQKKPSKLKGENLN